MFAQEELPDAHLRRWFLVFGAIGFAVAIGLDFLVRSDRFPTQIVLTLWPTSMVALIDPKTFWSQLAVIMITFGGQFLLYGFGGFCIGFVVFSVRKFVRRTRSS
jgi:hypothetical protein